MNEGDGPQQSHGMRNKGRHKKTSYS